MLKRGIPFIEINAKDNYDFGFKLGKALSDNIKDRIEKNKELYKNKAIKKLDFSVYACMAKKFIPTIKKHFPHLLTEAQAMAEGANVPFKDLFVLMCDEEIVKFKILHCLTIALRTKNNQLLLGHNEDWFPEYRHNGLALVRGRIEKTKFLSLGYMGSLAGSAFGMNSHGLAYSDTSFVGSRFEYKVPRSFHLRSILTAKTPQEAIKNLNIQGSIPSNTLIINSNKEILDIEEFWNKNQVFRGKDWMIHTNHPLLEKDRSKNNTEKESIIRYDRAYEIIMKEKEFTINTIKKILRDHKTKICEHPGKKITKFSVATISSSIMNPKEQYLMLCKGNPCKGRYVKYKL